MKLNVLTEFDPESITNKDFIERGLIEPSNSDLNTSIIQVGEKMEQSAFASISGK